MFCLLVSTLALSFGNIGSYLNGARLLALTNSDRLNTVFEADHHVLIPICSLFDPAIKILVYATYPNTISYPCCPECWTQLR